MSEEYREVLDHFNGWTEEPTDLQDVLHECWEYEDSNGVTWERWDFAEGDCNYHPVKLVLRIDGVEKLFNARSVFTYIPVYKWNDRREVSVILEVEVGGEDHE